MTLRTEPESIHDAEDAIGWLRGSLTFGRGLGSWVPHGHPRYARILHPAHEWSTEDDRVEERLVRWAEIASWSGTTLTARSSMDEIAVREDGMAWNRRDRALPMEGQLVEPHLDRLTRHLAAATATPDAVWLLVWSGYGTPGVTERTGRRRRMLGALTRRFTRFGRVPDRIREPAIEISSRLTGSGRTYTLHRGSVDASVGSERHGLGWNAPSFWWPADRAWFVSTDIDLTSTYVSGSNALIDGLLADDLLETFPADLGDRFGGGLAT
jgi:hypothetical protein